MSRGQIFLGHAVQTTPMKLMGEKIDEKISDILYMIYIYI